MYPYIGADPTGFFERSPSQMSQNSLHLLDKLYGTNGQLSPGLTKRETEVLKLIAEGFANKEIAVQIKVGVRTVESHRERIMRKLDIHNAAGLTRFAIAHNIIPAKNT
jgi:two-component system nitrate/nitrite response regulator NarL